MRRGTTMNRRRGADIETAHLATEAMRLRVKERLTLRQIAERLGVSHETVRRWVRAELTRDAAEREGYTRQLRALENLKLDELEDVVWPQAMTGDLRAVETELKLMERRSRLNKFDLSGGPAPAEQMERTLKVLRLEATDEELRAMAGGGAVPPRLVPLLPPQVLQAPVTVEVEGNEEEGAGDVEGDWSPIDPAS